MERDLQDSPQGLKKMALADQPGMLVEGGNRFLEVVLWPPYACRAQISVTKKRQTFPAVAVLLKFFELKEHGIFTWADKLARGSLVLGRGWGVGEGVAQNEAPFPTAWKGVWFELSTHTEGVDSWVSSAARPGVRQTV